MTNTTSQPISVAIDRRPIPRHVLTAGRLLRMPGIAAKLPASCVDTAFRYETTHSAILAVETQKPQPGADDPLKSWGAQVDALSVRYQPGRLLVRVADLTAALALIAPFVGKA